MFKMKKETRKALAKMLRQASTYGGMVFAVFGFKAGAENTLVATASWWVLFQVLALIVLNLDD